MTKIKGKVMLMRVAGLELVSQRELSIEISDEMLDRTNKRDAAKRRIPQSEYDISESIGGLYDSDTSITEGVTADSTTKTVTFDNPVQRLYEGQPFKDTTGVLGTTDEKYTVATVTNNSDYLTTEITVEESITDVDPSEEITMVVYQGVNDMITSIKDGTQAELYVISSTTNAPTYQFNGYVSNVSVEMNKDDMVTYSMDFASDGEITTGIVT